MVPISWHVILFPVRPDCGISGAVRRRIAIHLIANLCAAAGIVELIIAAREQSSALHHHSHFMAGVAVLSVALLFWIGLLIFPGSS